MAGIGIDLLAAHTHGGRSLPPLKNQSPGECSPSGVSGAANQSRTDDLVLTKDALYQLSHSSNFARFYRTHCIIPNCVPFVKCFFEKRKNEFSRRFLPFFSLPRVREPSAKSKTKICRRFFATFSKKFAKPIDKTSCLWYNNSRVLIRKVSSVGRASALQAEGQRFEPVSLHH